MKENGKKLVSQRIREQEKDAKDAKEKMEKEKTDSKFNGRAECAHAKSSSSSV